MSFDAMLDQIRELLRQRGRLSYGALKRRFDLDDAYVEDIKGELIKAERIAVDENGEVLVWAGKTEQGETAKDAGPSAAERRQLTVMFCDLVGSTALSAQLDPEDYRAVVQQHQQTCAEVIQRHEGYLAQYLGDGLLVYFGYPTAHEDDARRAVRTGLEITAAIAKQVPSLLVGEGQGDGAAVPHRPLQVRIGIHTGLVVIGDIGTSGRTEQLALGETPNIAARLQGLAEPNTVLISAATRQLVERHFECQLFGSHLLKGIDTPIAVYHVQSERQSGSQLESKTTLTPLIGREQEVGLLIDRWEQTKEGRGQVVLLSGEPGIGKSRLTYTLRERVTAEGLLLYEARCSSYHQHSAFYPQIDVLQRTLLLTRQESEEESVAKLSRALALYGMQESLPLFTALLSLPTPVQYTPLNLTPQKQKERTLQALVQLLVAQAERKATVSVWEDLHWADPSSLEFLSLLIEQIPTTKLLLVLTFRPEFTPQWKPRSHISQLVLNRLGKKQVQEMVKQIAAQAFRPSTGSGRTDLEAAEHGGPVRAELVEVRTAIPDSLINAVIDRTDGVPLFVEELTKSIIESVASRESRESPHPPLPLAIPATLQEALLARLDRLSSARQIVQLGATLGREFSYELLHAVSPISEADLQASLAKLVEAEILYQRGIGEQARYFFKHALIQDTAYQSLLKSTRQQYHQKIAKVLEERFPETKENQPELLAHHYTEAGLIEQSILYWQQAGQKAIERSANIEAINHLTKGLELLRFLPDSPERVQQELALQLSLGQTLTFTKGYAALEVGAVYRRTREICQQVGETPQLFFVLGGLYGFYEVRAEHKTALELAEQMMRLAQSVQDSALLLVSHYALGWVLFSTGEFVLAREHQEQGLALYDPQQHNVLAFRGSLFDFGVTFRSTTSWTLWYLGYPEQALKRNHEALTLAEELSHPFSLAAASIYAASFHQRCGEGQVVQELAEAVIALCSEQGFAFYLAWGIIMRGWALAEQGQGEEGIVQMRQGLATYRATGAGEFLPYFLALLAEAHGKVGQAGEGLKMLAEAVDAVDKSWERDYEAELYRLKGELLLAQESKRQKSENPNPKSQILNPSSYREAEACFLKAIDIACQQQAKS